MIELYQDRYRLAGSMMILSLVYYYGHEALFYWPEKLNFWDVKNALIFNLAFSLSIICGLCLRGLGNQIATGLFLTGHALSWVIVGYMVNTFYGNNLMALSAVGFVPTLAFYLLFVLRKKVGIWLALRVNPAFLNIAKPTALMVAMQSMTGWALVIEVGTLVYRWWLIWVTDASMQTTIWQIELELGYWDSGHLNRVLLDIATFLYIWRMIRLTRHDRYLPDLLFLSHSPAYEKGR